MTVTPKWPGARDDDTTLFVMSLITRAVTALGTDVGGANLDHYDHHDALQKITLLLEAAAEHSEPDFLVYRDDLDGGKWKARNSHTKQILSATSSTDPAIPFNAAGWALTLSEIDVSAQGGPSIGAYSGGGSIAAGDYYYTRTFTNALGESEIAPAFTFKNNPSASQQVTLTDPGSWPAGVTKVTVYRTKGATGGTSNPLRAGGAIPDYSYFYSVGDINTPGGTLLDNKVDASLGNNPTEPSLLSGGCIAYEMPMDGTDIQIKQPIWGHNQLTFRSVGRRARIIAHSTFDNTKGRAAIMATATASPDAANAGALLDFYQCDRIHITGNLLDGVDVAHRGLLHKRTQGRNTGTNNIGGDKSTSIIVFNEFVNGKYSSGSVALPNDTNDVGGATSNTWWVLNRMDNKSTGTNGPEAGPPSSLDINLGDGHYYINNLTGGAPPLFVNGVAVISIMGGHISGSTRGNIRVGGGGCGTLRVGGGMYLDNINGDNSVNPPTGGGIVKASGTGTANNWSLEGVHFNLNHPRCDAVNAHNLKSITISGGDASGCGLPVTLMTKSGAGPYTVVLTIGSGHGYSTSDKALVQELVTGGTAPNGWQTLTATTGTTISYSVAADPGAYTSGGFVGANHLFALRNITDEENGCIANGIVGGGGRTLQGWYNTGYGVWTGNAPQQVNGSAGNNDGTGMSERRGTATLANGTAAIVVAHKILGTPRHVVVVPTADTGAVRWWRDTITASSFTIRTNANVGANIVFDWVAYL